MAVDSQQRTFGAEAGSSVHLPWTQEAGEDSPPTLNNSLSLEVS